MIVYTGSSNEFCDLSMAAASLLQEGFSYEEVVWEIIEYCVINGVYVHKYDVETMLQDVVVVGAA